MISSLCTPTPSRVSSAGRMISSAFQSPAKPRNGIDRSGCASVPEAKRTQPPVKWSSPASGLTVTSTLAVPPAGTVTASGAVTVPAEGRTVVVSPASLVSASSATSGRVNSRSSCALLVSVAVKVAEPSISRSAAAPSPSTVAITWESSARSTWARPAPTCRGEADGVSVSASSGISAVFISMTLARSTRSAPVISGRLCSRCCSTSAAMPATFGEAMEVPEFMP